jgi:hypothetical protein
MLNIAAAKYLTTGRRWFVYFHRRAAKLRAWGDNKIYGRRDAK